MRNDIMDGLSQLGQQAELMYLSAPMLAKGLITVPPGEAELTKLGTLLDRFGHLIQASPVANVQVPGIFPIKGKTVTAMSYDFIFDISIIWQIHPDPKFLTGFDPAPLVASVGEEINAAKKRVDDSTQAHAPQTTKATINGRMLDLLTKKPECVNWSAQQFADHLKCAKTSVATTRAWRIILTQRKQGKTEQYQRQANKATRPGDSESER